MNALVVCWNKKNTCIHGLWMLKIHLKHWLISRLYMKCCVFCIRFYCYSDYDIVSAFIDFNFHFFAFAEQLLWQSTFFIMYFFSAFVYISTSTVCLCCFFFTSLSPSLPPFLNSCRCWKTDTAACGKRTIMHHWAWRELFHKNSNTDCIIDCVNAMAQINILRLLFQFYRSTCLRPPTKTNTLSAFDALSILSGNGRVKTREENKTTKKSHAKSN